jgi:hypothetical protein
MAATQQPNIPVDSQVYPGVQSFSDANQALAIRALWDRVHTIEGRPSDTSPTFRQAPNLGGTPLSPTAGLRITNAADPIHPGDLVTKRYADVTYAGPGLTANLTLGSPALANISSLLTSGSELLVGTHSQRLSLAASSGDTFYETDRHALYAYTTNWSLVGNAPEMQVTGVGALPSDLGANDVNFYARDTTTGMGWLWDGALWHWHSGIQYGLFTNRPVAFTGCDAGVIYCATDYEYTAWYLSYATGTWVHLFGVGGPIFVPISGLPGIASTLTANDAGVLAYATDYDRLYRWTGALAWTDAPGQPTRGTIAFFATAPGTGWALCNGAGATSSTSAGGTTGLTTPNLIGQFIIASSSSGGTGSAVAISYQTGATVLDAVNYTAELPYIRL